MAGYEDEEEVPIGKEGYDGEEGEHNDDDEEEEGEGGDGRGCHQEEEEEREHGNLLDDQGGRLLGGIMENHERESNYRHQSNKHRLLVENQDQVR